MSSRSVDALYGTVYGALYFSTLMTTAFYGVTCMQTFFYYVHYPNDPLRTKCFVGFLWVLDTIHDALVISGSYKYIAAGLVDPSSLMNGVPELIIEILFTVLVAVPAQGFFVYRIYIFSGKSIVPPLIWVPLAIYQLVSTFIYVVKAFYGSNGIHVAELSVLGDAFFMRLSISSLSVGAAADILIAACLTFLLIRKRPTSVLSSMATILQRLTVFAVNTGIWSAAFALLTLILLHRYPSNSIYTVFGIPLCSIYCNTVLANLNARAYILGEPTTHMESWRIGGADTDQRVGETKLIHTGGVTFSAANATQSTASAMV